VCCTICPTNSDPGANATPVVLFMSSTLARKKTIGPLTGNGVATIVHQISTSDIGGVRDLQIFDSYVGAVAGGAPAQNWYWFVGIFGTSNFVNGVAVDLNVDIELEFFELQQPAA
jgi:hypothetical protein